MFLRALFVTAALPGLATAANISKNFSLMVNVTKMPPAMLTALQKEPGDTLDDNIKDHNTQGTFAYVCSRALERTIVEFYKEKSDNQNDYPGTTTDYPVNACTGSNPCTFAAHWQYDAADETMRSKFFETIDPTDARAAINDPGQDKFPVLGVNLNMDTDTAGSAFASTQMFGSILVVHFRLVREETAGGSTANNKAWGETSDDGVLSKLNDWGLAYPFKGFGSADHGGFVDMFVTNFNGYAEATADGGIQIEKLDRTGALSSDAGENGDGNDDGDDSSSASAGMATATGAALLTGTAVVAGLV